MRNKRVPEGYNIIIKMIKNGRPKFVQERYITGTFLVESYNIYGNKNTSKLECSYTQYTRKVNVGTQIFIKYILERNQKLNGKSRGQMLVKFYEYDTLLHHNLFMDFEQAYNSLIRKKLLLVLIKLNTSQKLCKFSKDRHNKHHD